MMLAGLQLVEEFLTPLFPRFLGIWGQKPPLGNHTALQFQVLLNQVSHGPWVHLVMPCQLPYASLRIISHSPLDCGLSAFSAPRPWHEVLAVILQLFYLKNQAPADP
jgi:hypothetical protein